MSLSTVNKTFSLSRLLLIGITIGITACSHSSKQQSIPIQLESKTFDFIDQLLEQNKSTAKRQTIDAWLVLPQKTQPSHPYPVVVLLHSSWGLSSQEWFYAEQFKKAGIATIIVDSFTARGVAKTSTDQSVVSSASILYDAYSTIPYIHQHELLDRERIAVMGFSKGGIAALYAAVVPIRMAAGNPQPPFAAHIAYYPWCGLQLQNMQTERTPILIQAGSKDIVTPIQKCKDLVRNHLSLQDQSHVIVEEHPSARHAFDHPVLARIPWTVHMDAQIPANCHIEEIEPNRFVETSTQMPVTETNIGTVLNNCSSYHGTVKYNRKATQQALANTLDFLKRSLQLNH